MIKVVNKYKHKPTSDDLYIGRGSILGNPFTSIKHKQTKAQYICESRGESVERYENYLREKITTKDTDICTKLNNIFIRVKRGEKVNLVCFCKPKICHGDIIKKIIEEKL